MLASALTGIPYSMTLHGPEIFFEPKRWRLDEKIARAHSIFCISAYTRAQAMLCSDQKHWMKLHVSRCGVEPERYRPMLSRPPGREALFVGRLDRRKGIHVLLEAVAVLRDRLDTFHLTVVGDGPDRAWMERRVVEGGLKTFVTFAGPLDETGVAEAVRRADLLVAPGLAEGLPVVIMEALASGVPVVASAVGGVPELVRHGETGLLAPAGDPEGLADAMADLLACPDLRRSMGEAGRRLVCRDYDARLNAAALLARILNSSCRAPTTLKQNHTADAESNHDVTMNKGVDA
jgi:glycosyltransferase involved in cell wall biosynthesis